MKTSRFLQMFSRIYAISFVIALVGTVLCAALWNVFVGSSIRPLKWLWELRERYQFHKKAEEGLSPHGKIDD